MSNEQTDSITPHANLTVVESMCVSCGLNGTTRLLFTDIPHFKETLVSAFECPHCGYSNKDVQSISSLMDFGTKWTLNAQPGNKVCIDCDLQ